MPLHPLPDPADVFTRRQLLDAGLTPGHLAAQVAARRWQAPTSTVFVCHNGPLTELQQWWVATLAVGPLAGRTALTSWGLTGWSSDKVEVLPSWPGRAASGTSDSCVRSSQTSRAVPRH